MAEPSTDASINLWGREVAAVSWLPEDGFAVFQYDPEFAQSEIELSPLVMPLSPDPYSFPALPRTTFKGLPGMLADALPDKYGDRLINAWLAEQGRTPESFNPVERLCYVGTRGMGALEFKPALMGKNRALELKGQSDEALRTATWAAKYVGPAADQYVFLASEYEQRGDLDTALLHYRQALAMEPNNANVHKGLGMLHLKAGRQDLAIKSLHRSLELNPSQQDVVATLRELGESVPSVEYGP